MFGSDVCVYICVFLFFFFSRVLRQILLLRLLLMHCAWTVAAKFNLSNNFQPINAHYALFTDSQISLFSNFFIKNWSHGTIHTFKNYFAIMFFSFQFHFLVFSCIQTDPYFSPTNLAHCWPYHYVPITFSYIKR